MPVKALSSQDCRKDLELLGGRDFGSNSMGDFDKIWREHCEDEETLSEYAVAMKNLADNHWAKTCDGEGRIEWCRRTQRPKFIKGKN
ncbi:UNVERIFIED_CONTAM: hypothetical protein FKN15_071432 [Acipenser sinensis]